MGESENLRFILIIFKAYNWQTDTKHSTTNPRCSVVILGEQGWHSGESTHLIPTSMTRVPLLDLAS